LKLLKYSDFADKWLMYKSIFKQDVKKFAFLLFKQNLSNDQDTHSPVNMTEVFLINVKSESCFGHNAIEKSERNCDK
jgi:hypothetical protein